MVLRCVMFGCSSYSGHKSRVSVHSFPPTDSPYRRLWINFVKSTRQDFSEPEKHHGICGLHFRKNCYKDEYTRLLKLQAGFRQYRQLKVDSVPTIHSEKCIAALSKHSPVAVASKRQAYSNNESVREKRIRMREMLKDIQSIKRAHTNITCSTLDTLDATSSCANISVSDIVADVPSNMLSELYEFQMPPASKPEPKFADIGVGTGKQRVHHHGITVNLRPHKRSKGIWIKPQHRTIAVQCNLHICECEQSFSEPLSVENHFKVDGKNDLQEGNGLHSDSEKHNLE